MSTTPNASKPAGNGRSALRSGPVADVVSRAQSRSVTDSTRQARSLLGSVIADLGATVERVVVTDISDGTFYAKVVLAHGGTTTEVDARPSDAIALAVRVGAPIFAEESVLEQAAVDVRAELERPWFRDTTQPIN